MPATPPPGTAVAPFQLHHPGTTPTADADRPRHGWGDFETRLNAALLPLLTRHLRPGRPRRGLQVDCVVDWPGPPEPTNGHLTRVGMIPAPLTLTGLLTMLPTAAHQPLTVTWDGTVLTVAAGLPHRNRQPDHGAGQPDHGVGRCDPPTRRPAAQTAGHPRTDWLTAYPFSAAQRLLADHTRATWRYGWTPAEPVPALITLCTDDAAARTAIDLDLAWAQPSADRWAPHQDAWGHLPPLAVDLLTIALPPRQDRACPLPDALRCRPEPTRQAPAQRPGVDIEEYPRCLRLAYTLTVLLADRSASERAVLTSLLRTPGSWRTPLGELLEVAETVVAPAA
jgi:hypothetical protein